MTFDFATAGRIRFGCGIRHELGAAARSFGKRALLVCGGSLDRVEELQTELPDPVCFQVDGEPTVEIVRQGVAMARHAACDVVVAQGGGSVIDAGKAIAALISNGGDPLDYLEVVGEGLSIAVAPVPFLAVPTTAGTGAEVTRNAVLGVPKRAVKASMRSPLMLPALALIDPELTAGLPAALTASTGLDALTQCMEPYTSIRANPLTDLWAAEGVRLVVKYLGRAVEAPGDLEARSAMALASLYGGLSLANSGLGAVHGFAAPIGGRFNAPHGAVCGALLPSVTAANVSALRRRAPRSEALVRYEHLGNLLGAGDVVAGVRRLRASLPVPGLGTYGIREQDVAGLVEAARQASSMKGNAIELTPEELADSLREAL